MADQDNKKVDVSVAILGTTVVYEQVAEVVSFGDGELDSRNNNKVDVSVAIPGTTVVYEHTAEMVSFRDDKFDSPFLHIMDRSIFLAPVMLVVLRCWAYPACFDCLSSSHNDLMTVP